MQIGRLLIGKDYFLFCKAIQLHTKKSSPVRELYECVWTLSLTLSVLTLVITAMMKEVKRCLIEYHAVETYMEAGIELQFPTVLSHGKEPLVPIAYGAELGPVSA